ncbi:MAG: AI-2E family transporter [Burkholderiaceae bacterium]|nr:AI-2E family transporter [Burkholderiaceae bacterium]
MNNTLPNQGGGSAGVIEAPNLPSNTTPASVPVAGSPGQLVVASSSNLGLTLLAVFGGVLMLHWASAVFIPLMLGLIFSYALAPAVAQLQRLRVPRTAAAALLLSLLLGGAGWLAFSLSGEATRFVESLPEAAQKIRQAASVQRNGAMEKVQQAATRIEQAAKEGGSGPPTAERGVTRVQIERSRFNLKDYVWSSMPAMTAAVGQATAVLFITFFLLASGDSFRRKIVHLAGPTLARRKLTIKTLDEITLQIQRYLVVQVLISVLVGLATGLAFLAIGLENAAVWGVLAFGLNFVPYLGSIALTAGGALVGFVQFGSIDMAALVVGASLTVHVISGNLLTPWLTSRASRLNPIAVFVGVLAFGWLWGLAGLILGMPILLMVKAVCDRVDDLHPVGELLGR